MTYLIIRKFYIFILNVIIMKARFTIKNYRCFSDEKPLVFDLEPGFIALVGPNNSGKSTLLKFFYEFRFFWSGFNIDEIITIMNNKNTTTSIPYNDVLDPQEIFNNTNHRTLSIKIELLGIQNSYLLSAINIEISREYANKAKIKIYCGADYVEVKSQVVSKKSQDEIYLKSDDFILYCSDFFKLLQKLSNCMYIGSFRNALNKGSGSDYDINIGTSLISNLKAWKTGHIIDKNKQIIKVTEDIRNIFEFNELEINSSDDNTTLQIMINKEPYKLKEVGSGIAQFIIVFVNVAIKKPSYILIDEPELNLHPQLQRDFLMSLASYASDGVLFATHSIGLAKSITNKIYSIQNKKNISELKKIENTSNYVEFLGELSYSAYKELGFEKVLLVEGVTEVKFFQQVLRMIRKDHQIFLLPLGGSSFINRTVEHELKEIHDRLGGNLYCIIDSEKNSETSELDNDRKEFKVLCERIGINLHILERRATENYFTDKAIKSIFPNCSALTKYENLKNKTPRWSKSNNWKIVREMSWEDIKDTDLGIFIDSL